MSAENVHVSDAMQAALAVLQSAVSDLKNESLREIRDTVVNRVLECGVLVQQTKAIDRLSEADITGPEEHVDNVKKAIAELQQITSSISLRLMGDKAFVLIRFLQENVSSLSQEVQRYCNEARAGYDTFFDFVSKVQKEFTQAEGNAPLPEEKLRSPKQEWTEEEIERAQEFLDTFGTALQSARMQAEPGAIQDEIHNAYEALRIAEELVEKANQHNRIIDEVMASLGKIASAHDTIIVARSAGSSGEEKI